MSATNATKPKAPPRCRCWAVLACVALTWLLAGPSATDAAPAASRPSRPNILFCVADDWSFGHAGAYGCTWVKTPAFDRVARGGLLFTRAYTPNAKCAPSRACILTGRNPWQLEAACNHECIYPLKFTSYPETLAAHGYFVGCTGKGWAPGVALDADGKPRRLTGRPFDRRTAPPPTTGIAANDYAANFRDFLDAAGDAAKADPKGQAPPWCFWYGCREPHRPYEFGSGVRVGGKKPSDIDRVPAFWPDNDTVRNDLLDYAVEVEHFDRHLGRMLDLLEQRGQLDDTLVVVTSDNGMPFPRVKGQEYDGSNHLPLAIMWPHRIRNPGRRIDDFVSFIDFAPTFVELAGQTWEQTAMQPATGRSLKELFNSDKAGRIVGSRDHVLIGKERHDVGRPHDWGYPIRGIVETAPAGTQTGDWLYLHNYEPTRWPACNPETGYLNCDGGPTKTEVLKSRTATPATPFWKECFGKRGAEELYDLAHDPDCLTNLAADPAHHDRLEAMKARMERELRAQDDPRMSGHGDVFEKYPYGNAAVRNFYERYMAGEKLKAGWVNPSDFEKVEDD